MQQEDRLKWSELISKVGFFSSVAIVVVISIILYILIF